MCVTTLRLQRHDVSPHSTGKDTMHHHIFTFFWGRTKKGSKALQLHHLSVGHWDIVFYLVHNILQQEPLHGLYDSIATVGEIRVYRRADFQSGSRGLKKVF